MISYRMMIHPTHQKIYLERSPELALLELQAVSNRLETALLEPAADKLAGCPALAFSCETGLSREELKTLGRLSCFYALFRREGELYAPVEAPEFRQFPDSYSELLKYNGKTNERFTRLLINLAWAACALPLPQTLLDPLCGKGTTLFEAAIAGFNGAGIEQNSAWCAEGQSYLTRFLEKGRYKHKTSRQRPGKAGGGRLGEVFCVQTACSKERFEEHPQMLRLAHGDTKDAGALYGKSCFDLLVADLPYGVQHGSRAGGNLSRSPLELLRGALPAWLETVRRGGGLALAFNEYTIRRGELCQLLEEQGCRVLDGPFEGYRHRVDQAINRDLVVAVKEKKRA